MNVLVCITPQSNGRRLIDEGALIAGENKGASLHILHMQRSGDPFINENTGEMLEELFNYGKTKNGVIHFISGDNFLDVLQGFAEENGISHVVLGAPPLFVMTPERLKSMIFLRLPGVRIHIVRQLG